MLWQETGVACIQDKKHCERVVEALNLQHAKTVVTPAVRQSESVDGENIRECSWESVRAPDTQSEKGIDARCAGRRQNKFVQQRFGQAEQLAVDRPDIQHAAGVRSKSMSSPRVNDRQRLKRVVRCVKGRPDTGIMFEWQIAPSRLIVQSDSDWAGDKSTGKSVAAGNIRLRSASAPQLEQRQDR